MDQASTIWSDLKTRFSRADCLRISDLQMEAITFHQGDISFFITSPNLKPCGMN